MNRLDRYIAKTVLSAVMLVTLMLIGFQIFLLFINELDDIGRGSYHIQDVFQVIALQLPGEVYLFFPVACLIGALMGLGSLANHSELVVMQASGLSIKRITWAVLKASVLVIIFVACLGELFAPTLLAEANAKRWRAISGGETMHTEKGVWFKHDNDFLVIEEVQGDSKLKNVTQFHFDDTHKLAFTRRIEQLDLNPESKAWQASNVKQTEFMDKQLKTQYMEVMPWDIPLDTVALKTSQKEPDELTFLALRAYVKSPHPSGLFFKYKLTYFQRMMQPFTTVVMMMLAIPFIFGPLRSSTMGAKLLLGIGTGFGFYLFTRFFGPLAQILHWPPEVAAMLPTLLFACVGLVWMGRVKS